jgi:cyclopropane fatty-acyl-phospholipid synthase-like methyltransferase
LKGKKIKSILDYGAGLGLTSMQLAESFPNAKVYYYNYPGSLQDKFFLSLKDSRINYLKKVDGEYDVIFCSELFEHIKRPLDLLKDLMNRCNRYFCTSNAFGTKSYGHYDLYDVNGGMMEPRRTSKIFYKTMREQFKDAEIPSWNGRPRLFIRK